jgi:ATP-binding cassette subfamily F protein 3
MITIANLCKSYGNKVLFSDVSLNINRGEKIGLIGPNGAGKTTLFSLILKDVEPSSGNIHIHKNIRIGYLPQESHFASKITVLREVTEGNDIIMRLKEEKDALEAKNETGTKRYGELLHRLEDEGYFELEYKAKKIMMGLGFKQGDFDRPMKELSGGWQMRVLLAKLLTYEYDILLLDEPTNHLDLNAALWFKDYLAGFDGTFVMISHDKDFLDDVTNYTLILENGKLVKFHGNYEHYRKMRDEQKTYLLKQAREQEKKQKQLERFVERFHAQPNKASQVRAKRKALERMEEIIMPQDPRRSIRTFKFPATKESGHQVIALESISKAYGNIQVYKDFDFEIVRGEKAVLVGENGAGKSTLLKILAGVIDIDSGRRSLGYNVTTGYFSQARMEVLTAHNSVLEEAYLASGGALSEEAVRTILGAFLFSGDDVSKKVSVLSGGEKSRLILAKLLINPPNFLLLDEPTTHLDINAVEALIKALNDYAGSLVFISHDIHFVRSVANTVFEVKEGVVKKYPGDFDYYLTKKSGDGELREKIKKKHLSLQKPEGNEEEPNEVKGDEEEQIRKSRNTALINRIKKLRKEKKRLETEYYVKERIILNRYSAHSEETKKAYAARLPDIKKRLAEIENEIKNAKSKFF